MYSITLLEVIKKVAREKAYREYAMEAMFLISENPDIKGLESIEILKNAMDMVEPRTYKLISLILEDYYDKFMYPNYELFINENKPKTLKTTDITEDYLLVEFKVDEDNKVWFMINKCETLEEVEETIFDKGNLYDMQDLIVLEKGKVKDFIVEPCKCCFMQKVSWSNIKTNCPYCG